MEQEEASLAEGPVFSVDLAKNILIGFLVLALLFSWFSPIRNGARDSVPAASQKIDLVGRAASAFISMESANRGFLLTGDPSFRDNFTSDRDKFSDSYKVLMVEAEGVPSRKEKLRALKDKFTRWFQLYNPMIQNRRLKHSYEPDRFALQECRILHEDILRDLQSLQSASFIQP